MLHLQKDFSWFGLEVQFCASSLPEHICSSKQGSLSRSSAFMKSNEDMLQNSMRVKYMTSLISKNKRQIASF